MLSLVRYPSETYLVGDAKCPSSGYIQNASHALPCLRRNDGWNCCFVDGHVEWLSDSPPMGAPSGTTDPPWCHWRP